MITETGNITWERNHETIENAYAELMQSNLDKGILKRPSITAIAKRAGVDRNTVYKHLEKFKIKDGALVHRLKLDTVLEALSARAMTGDVAAIKLYAQLVCEWSEKTVQDVTVKETPTLKVQFVDKEEKEIEEKEAEDN